MTAHANMAGDSTAPRDDTGGVQGPDRLSYAYSGFVGALARTHQRRRILEHVFGSPANWKASLNPKQLEAVTVGDGPILVIAGAGTGKTWTLACRVAHLIEQGVPPERVLLLTVSRRAAKEMLTRADRLNQG